MTQLITHMKIMLDTDWACTGSTISDIELFKFGRNRILHVFL